MMRVLEGGEGVTSGGKSVRSRDRSLMLREEEELEREWRGVGRSDAMTEDAEVLVASAVEQGELRVSSSVVIILRSEDSRYM